MSKMEELGYLITQPMAGSLANQIAMMSPGKPCGDDEASTLEEMEVLRV